MSTVVDMSTWIRKCKARWKLMLLLSIDASVVFDSTVGFLSLSECNAMINHDFWHQGCSSDKYNFRRPVATSAHLLSPCYCLLLLMLLTLPAYAEQGLRDGRLSVRLFVPSINRSSSVRRVCCWAPHGQEISICCLPEFRCLQKSSDNLCAEIS